MLPGLVLHEAGGPLTPEAEKVLRECEGLCLPRFQAGGPPPAASLP